MLLFYVEIQCTPLNQNRRVKGHVRGSMVSTLLCHAIGSIRDIGSMVSLSLYTTIILLEKIKNLGALEKIHVHLGVILSLALNY